MKKYTIEIDEEYIQTEAESMLGRHLSSDEYDDVVEEICGNLVFIVQDAIGKVLCFNELVENNKDTGKKSSYYKMLHRNKNAFKFDFSVVINVSSLEEAEHYISHGIVTEYDEWKVVYVEDGIPEKCVYTLNC